MYEMYFDLGLQVVQVAKRGKNPLGVEWQNRAATSAEQIEQWVEDGFNIGVILGPPSEIVDVELDSPEAEEAWKKLNIECWTPTFKGKRGLHRLFRMPAGLIRKTVVKPHGIECRIGNAIGPDGRPLACQSVFPPSVHESGHQYQWVEGMSIDDFNGEFMELPAILFQMINDESCHLTSMGVPGTKIGGSGNIVEDGASEGGRNNSLFKHGIKRCYEHNVSQMTEDIRDYLLNDLKMVNKLYCKPPLSLDEVERVMRSALKAAGETQEAEKTEMGIFDSHDDVIGQGEQKIADQLRNQTNKLERKERELTAKELERAHLKDKSQALIDIHSLNPAEVEIMPQRKYEKTPGAKELRKSLRRLHTVEKEIPKIQNVIETTQDRIEQNEDKLDVERNRPNRRDVVRVNEGELGIYEDLGLVVTREQSNPGSWHLQVTDSMPPMYHLLIPALSEFLAGVGGRITLSRDQLFNPQKVSDAILDSTGTVCVAFRPIVWDRIWKGRADNIGVLQALLASSERVYNDDHDKILLAAEKMRDFLSMASSNQHVDTPSINGNPIWRHDGCLWFNWKAAWETASHKTDLSKIDFENLKRSLLNSSDKSEFTSDEYFFETVQIKVVFTVWKKSEEWKALLDLCSDNSREIRSGRLIVEAQDDSEISTSDQSSEDSTA